MLLVDFLCISLFPFCLLSLRNGPERHDFLLLKVPKGAMQAPHVVPQVCFMLIHVPMKM